MVIHNLQVVFSVQYTLTGSLTSETISRRAVDRTSRVTRRSRVNTNGSTRNWELRPSMAQRARQKIP